MPCKPLPFYDERKTPVDMLLLHCSAQDTNTMLTVLEEQKLSCHYIIDTDGTVTSVVNENKRAWHGGLGSWRNIKEDINSHSIGIELCHPTLGQSPYPDKQMAALIELAQDIVKRHHIPQQNIVGHSDTAPTRKADPGKCFPWQYLAQNGLGLWYRETQKITNTKKQKMLSDIGYDISNLTAAQYAFCRHFLPEAVATEDDILYLIEHVFPENADICASPKFDHILNAVWHCYAAERLKG